MHMADRNDRDATHHLLLSPSPPVAGHMLLSLCALHAFSRPDIRRGRFRLEKKFGCRPSDELCVSLNSNQAFSFSIRVYLC